MLSVLASVPQPHSYNRWLWPLLQQQRMLVGFLAGSIKLSKPGFAAGNVVAKVLVFVLSCMVSILGWYLQ